MKSTTRAALAQETVQICQDGSYRAPSSALVPLKLDLARATSGTRLFDADELLAARLPEPSGTPARITVTAEPTLDAIRRLALEGEADLACLNFASARNPGGGFLGGAEAQEESLARSSGLYPCQLTAGEYYRRNRAHRSALYLDLLIWSPGVPFIRDSMGTLLERPCHAGVITAPAPNAGAVSQNEPAHLAQVPAILERRAEAVLRLAVAQGVRRLVLGAWGCGVFRNDPQMVAETFARLLSGPADFAKHFTEVVFAVFDRTNDAGPRGAFERVFAK